jgi:hypothetical protein
VGSHIEDVDSHKEEEESHNEEVDSHSEDSYIKLDCFLGAVIRIPCGKGDRANLVSKFGDPLHKLWPRFTVDSYKEEVHSHIE